MFSKAIDVVLGRNQTMEVSENTDSGLAEAIIWLVWFSTMLYFALSVI
jgi:hypothetical protein